MGNKSRKPHEQPSLFVEEGEAPLIQPPELPKCWSGALAAEFAKPYFTELTSFVDAERAKHDIFPPKEDVYAAFRETPLNSVRVVILGQDPYPTPGQGHGIAFSVRPGVSLPGSLRNIYRELNEDMAIPPVKHGFLKSWANCGVLLLNAVLTVRSGKPASHAGKGWETFTDAALRAVNALPQKVVFLLWGNYAQKKASLIDGQKHVILKSAHPSHFRPTTAFSAVSLFPKQTRHSFARAESRLIGLYRVIQVFETSPHFFRRLTFAEVQGQ